METSQKNTICESNDPIQCENIGKIRLYLAMSEELKTIMLRLAALRKGRKSGYNVFMGEKMKELKAADSDLKGKDAMKAASKIWKTLKESEKENYRKRELQSTSKS